MPKTASLNLRLQPQLKREAETLFSAIGLTMSDAFTLFLHQAIQEGGLPFTPHLVGYNADTLAAMREAKDVARGVIPAKTYHSVREMADDLDAEEAGDVEC
ncbi:MAG: type II toxin-antitoxin system RelB/DinJ family antitoxin [Oscillospiraceae bacterium]|nr:type II toxin-antitoxin system RelB/DinJ family antitoxin [Oscillospiraceae bacterium]